MDEQSSSSNSSSGIVVDSKPTQRELNEEALKNFTTSATSSWTILPADRIEILDSTSDESTSVEGKATGEQESNSEPANERCKPLNDPDPQTEDFSDGISIISDCESTGRVTPNPMFRGLLNELNLDLRNDLPATPLLNHQQLRARRRNEEMQQLDDEQVKAASITRPSSELSEQQQQQQQKAEHQTSLMGYRLPALVHNGLTAVFYVGATLAILAFIGRLRNPEWQVLGGNKPSAELEQRLVDLELQNNLMRAEIDIISKQLNYLSGQGQSQSHSQSPQQQAQQQGRKVKTFKAWPGNGDSVDPVDITKQDLKRPYRCPDGKFVEIAGMCMESKPHAESLADEIGNVVNDVLQQSQTFQNFEKVTERLGTLAGNDLPEQASETPKTFHAHHAEKDNRQDLPQYNQRSDAVKDRYQTRNNYKKCTNNNGYKCNENDSNEHSKERTRSISGENDSNEHSKERTRPRSNENDSNEHSKERIRSRSGENDSNEHSKENTRSRSNENDSKERHHKKYADKSKERYGKKPQRGNNHDSGSGEWHERMMQQREHARQRHEQKRNNNWYIERGGSREQRRSGETRH